MQVTKMTKALIEANINDDEIDEQLDFLRQKRMRDAGEEERDANAALVSNLNKRWQ